MTSDSSGCGEPDLIARPELDEASRDGLGDGVRRAVTAGPAQQLDRGTFGGARRQQRLSASADRPHQPGQHQLAEAAGDRHRLGRVERLTAFDERPAEFEGEERVAAADLVDPGQHRPGPRGAAVLLEQRR